MGSATASGPERRGFPSIARLLGAVHLAILVVPVVALLALRVVDRQLVEATERGLIAEAAVVGEAYRAALLEARGEGVGVPPQAPPWARDERYWPVEAVVHPRRLAPPEPPPSRTVQAQDRIGPAWLAGASLGPLLARSQRLNMSGVRVLDREGCVVGSSGSQVGDCLGDHPEVRDALHGRYAAVGRRRVSDEPTPPLTSMRRRGKVRLFAALPVVHDGEVIGVVRASRTALDPLEFAWRQRGVLLLALLLAGASTWAISCFLSRAIAGPVRSITDEARRVAEGRATRLSPPRGPVPAEVAELAQALSTMTDRLAGHAAEVADFAATLSHELKTPIAAMRGAMELLRESWDSMSPAQRERFLGNADADAARMERLVTRLLVLARIRSADEPAPCDDVEGELRALAARYEGHVELRLEGVPGRVAVPADHLRMAVGNLLENAVEHGEGRPVELSGDTSSGRLRVRVRDRGPGISEGNRARVFERFFTTRRDSGGTGLGLSIVRAVAESCGGSVDFETGPGGTTFTLVV